MNAIVYDVEIKNCTPVATPEPDLTYCESWTDYAGMGIACICAYDYQEERFRVFAEDNLADFAALVRNSDHVIGFNSKTFDDLVCRANGIEIETTYDLLLEIRRATGQPDGYIKGLTRPGYSLDAFARANLNIFKSGDGATAPALWQRGQRGQVIDYCLLDVELTKRLFEMRTRLIDPTTDEMIRLPDLAGRGPVYEIRVSLRLTQQQLADKLGCSIEEIVECEKYGDIPKEAGPQSALLCMAPPLSQSDVDQMLKQ